MNNTLSLSRFYVFLIIIFLLNWLIFRYFTPLGYHVRHTYELPSTNCTNRLTSDLWTYDTVREGLFVLYILVPFSICLMMWTREKVAWGAHLAVVCVGLAWSIVMVGFDANDLSHANVPPSDVNFRPENLARDRQWCLFYAGQPGTELLCANTGICQGAPAVDPATFGPNTPFLMRFIFNILLIAFAIVAIWVATLWKRVVIKEKSSPVATRMRYTTLK